MTFADDQVVYRDLDGAWGSFRLFVGGKDVTFFRGVPSQIGGYQLQEPYGYGPADFAFPQITPFEVDTWGTGDLSWFDMGKPAKLVQVDADGVYVRDVWRGFITNVEVDDDGTRVQCDGEASGRLALRDKHDELFYFTKDIGRLLWEAFNKARLPLSPHLGMDTGLEVYERGRAGGSFLDYCNQLLGEAMTADGDQLTIHPTATGYETTWKDRATVHGTVFYGAAGVSLRATRDLQEEPTTIYGQGRDPEGLVWVNGKYPGLIQGDAPDFPGTLSLGDTGDNVQVLQQKLIGMGYLDGDEAVGNEFNEATEDAVIALQDDAGLAQTGVVNAATWDSLYDLGDTGFSLRQAHVAPLAQLNAVRKQNRTSNGSLAGFNEDYDADRVEVDRTIDFRITRKRRARKWSRRHLSDLHATPAWVGTLELSTDLAAGDHTHGTAPTPLSRLDLTPGQNIRVRNFGDLLFHVSGVNVDADQNVTAAVDTHARDLLHIGQILERNREARSRPAREFLRDRRPTSANSRIVEFSEVGGRLWSRVNLTGDQWCEPIPIIAGQSGTLNRVRTQVRDSECEFVMIATAKKVSRAWLNDLESNPFGANAFRNQKVYQRADEERVILGIWGTPDEPGGYAPGAKSEGDDLTGLLLEDAGVPYYTFDQPVIWVSYFPRQDCHLPPQRILWPLIDAGT